MIDMQSGAGARSLGCSVFRERFLSATLPLLASLVWIETMVHIMRAFQLSSVAAVAAVARNRIRVLTVAEVAAMTLNSGKIQNSVARVTGAKFFCHTRHTHIWGSNGRKPPYMGVFRVLLQQLQ